MSAPLPVRVCLLTHPHYAHDWWFTSSGGGHMLDAFDESGLERDQKQWHCPGVAPVTPPLTSSEPTERNDMSNQYRDAVQRANAHEAWVCPRCDHPTSDFPALSRRDNITAVCSRCGTEEAMRTFGGLHPWPTDDTWPFLLSAMTPGVRR